MQPSHAWGEMERWCQDQDTHRTSCISTLNERTRNEYTEINGEMIEQNNSFLKLPFDILQTYICQQ